MKRLIIILFCFGVSSSYLQAQTSADKDNDLIHVIVGTWKVIKLQSKAGTDASVQPFVFKSDGTFEGDSIHFGTRSGLFRTDENRGILILENGKRTTEWITTLKKGVLRMRSIPRNKEAKVYITSIRFKESSTDL